MMTASSKTIEAGRARAPLDRRRIAAAALSLIDARGIEQLSMRSIGAALEVEAMALYYYFGNKAELLNGVRDYLLDQLTEALQPDGEPLDRVRAAFEDLRLLGMRHPGVMAMLGSTAFRSEAALRYYEKLMEAMFAAGLSPLLSARYFGILSQFTIGSCLFTAGTAPAREPGSVGPSTLMMQSEADFRFGLDLILRKLQGEQRAN